MNPNFKRVIKKETIESKFLQDQKEIILSIPPGYQEHQKYPVLLLHDGDDYFQMGRIVTQANPLIDQGQLEPFLIIGIPVNKKKRNQEYSPNGKSHKDHLQFVLQELRPFIQQKYAADFSPHRWVVGGSSLGGTVSLHLALTYPDQCQRVLSQSGAFLDETLAQIEESRHLSTLQIYQSIGLNETKVPTHMGNLDLLTQNRKAYHLLQKKQATVKYVESPGEHTWRLWQNELPQALNYFFGNDT